MSQIGLSNLFVGHENALAEAISPRSIEADLRRLNESEGILTESDFFDLHFDIILGGRAHEYHRGLALGRNSVLESAREIASGNYLSAINEQISQADSAILGALAAGQNVTGQAGEKKSVFDYAKELLSAITEGGSTIGIFHLLLDIAGLVLDPVGAGFFADLANAVIYFWRSRQPGAKEGLLTLSIISVISAVIPVAGDSLKVFKPFAKSAESVITAFGKGSKEGKAAVEAVPVAQKSMVKKFLNLLLRYMTEAVSKLSGVFAKLSSGFANRITSKIPFIGGPITRLLKKMSNVLNELGAKMATVAKNMKTAAAASKTTGKTAAAAGKVSIKDAAKGLIRLPYKAMSWAFSAVFKYHKRALFFVGKQYLKWLNDNGESGAEQIVGNTSDEEAVEKLGAMYLSNYAQRKAEEKKKETGAVYIPDVMIDSSNKEDFDHVTNYINYYADLYGQPKIIPVDYERYDNAEVIQEVYDFIKNADAGKITVSEDGQFKSSETNESISEFLVTFDRFTKRKRHGA